jgi:mono/diheme cytochrome c family protein
MKRWLIAGVVAAVAAAGACGRDRRPGPAKPLETAFRATGTSALEERGRRLFGERCATCHGQDGRGDGQNAYSLDPPPPDFSASLGALPESGRRLIIEKGSAAAGRSALCPPWGRVLEPDEVGALLAHLRVLERTLAHGSKPRR